MKPLNILIVEDEVLIAEDLHDIIKSFGYKNIKMAHTKSDGIALLNQFYFDVVLLDIRMEKELDGLVFKIHRENLGVWGVIGLVLSILGLILAFFLR